MTQTQELIERLRDGVIYDDEGEILRVATKALMRAAADRLSQLEGEVGRLREALREIAKQVPAKDMDEDYYEAADFEDGYDRCVFAARAALERHDKGEKL